MHSPNPMFPAEPGLDSAISPTSPTAWYLGQAPSLDHVNTTPSYTSSPPGHRRVNSDLPPATMGPSRLRELSGGSAAGQTTSSARRASHSRIPISTRRTSYTSDSGHSSQSSRPDSKVEKPLVPRQAVARRTAATPEQAPPIETAKNGGPAITSARNTPKPMRQATSPRRAPQTPSHSKSPRRYEAQQEKNGEKSTYLRANIIAPPPERSPPLRSSRPRQSVSTASTAASRAKIADKINAMQAKADPRSLQARARPRRPPELSNIDLEARRKRITQAFNHTIEANERKRQIKIHEQEIAALARQESALHGHEPAPAILVNEPEPSDEADHDVYKTPATDYAPIGRPLRVQTLAQPSLAAAETDSPTLGTSTSNDNGRVGGAFLTLQPKRYEPEPLSAVTNTTVETEGTLFDNEPQADDLEPYPSDRTVLNHVMQMRGSSPVIPQSMTHSESADESSDHADQESIQIMLRNTAIFEDDTVNKAADADELARKATDQEVLENVRTSWTSSLEESSPSFSQQRDSEEQDDKDSDRSEQMESSWTAAADTSPESARSTSRSEQYDNEGDGGFEEVPSLNRGHVAESHDSDHMPLEHRYQSNLASAEDWASASPSVNDWMRFSARDPVEDEDEESPPAPPAKDDASDALSQETERPLPAKRQQSDSGLGLSLREPVRSSIASLSPPPRPPSHSPPPVPPIASRSIDANASTGVSPSIYGSQPPSSTFSTPLSPPDVPRRVTSLSRIDSQNVESRLIADQPTAATITEERPSLDQPSVNSSSKRSSPNPEQRRLRIRRNVIKELIDTEAVYGRDMAVVIDIYKGTHDACMNVEEAKILFGNSEEIVEFSAIFLNSLKQAARTVYVISKAERFKVKRDGQSLPWQMSVGTGANNTSDDASSMQESELPDRETDRYTSIGAAFKAHIQEMEQVYTTYLKNSGAASRKLESLMKHERGSVWLKECHKYHVDLTDAWDLDSLLVKPVQRILKYPLLLQHLIELTPEDHPDYNSLLTALQEIKRVSVDINEKKKQSDLVVQALTRQRKESDVRKGFARAFGRRTEKIKQSTGISEPFADPVYDDLENQYTMNYGHLVVVVSDVKKYRNAVIAWVERLDAFGLAADNWVDVHHGPWPELESKLRQFAMMVRDIKSLALPEHLASVTKHVINPMMRGATDLEKMHRDQKGLLVKRNDRATEYAKYKNLKNRGEKLSKKILENMEQWEALNREAKERMGKLLVLTETLANLCLHNFVQIHLKWLHMLQRKLPAPMNITLTDVETIKRDWQQDFDYQEATAQAMSICNGSLLAEAVNMLNFLTPSTTLNGDDSPRQSSWNSGNKRSISLNSESSPALPTDYMKRNSGSFGISPMFESPNDHPMPPFANGRIRATSVASGRTPAPAEVNPRVGSMSAHTGISANAATVLPAPPRPSTSTGRSDGSQFPRLSIDAPSPYIGSLRASSPATRPASSSTFYSSNTGPSHAPPTQVGQSGSVFSSAMPMSESPQQSGTPVNEPTMRDYTVMFAVASVYEFNIDRARREAGFPYLTYVAGEIFDVIGERGELWLARNQDDPTETIGWIWNKHFRILDK